jgi:hypothetical protein
MRRFRYPHRSTLMVLVLVGMVVAAAPAAAATDRYTSQSTGYDVSYPNCTGTLPSSAAFGIVGVTDGHAFTQNPCFAREYTWAGTNMATPASAYMNLNEAIGTTASDGATGPKGTCAKSDKACYAYNYGYNAAAAAYDYAANNLPAGAAMPTTWWLDIETANSWSAKTSLNRMDIQGAIDSLSGRGSAVGIYSTPAMWKTITGAWQNGLPAWVAASTGTTATTAISFCGTGFTGGPVWLVQYASGGSDHDYAC